MASLAHCLTVAGLEEADRAEVQRLIEENGGDAAAGVAAYEVQLRGELADLLAEVTWKPEAGRQAEQTAAGTQFLIDGVQPLTTRERVQSLADAPLISPTRRSDTEIGGLFDANDPARYDLFDQVPVGAREVDGRLVAETVSRQELAAELDADDEFAQQVGLCLK